MSATAIVGRKSGTETGKAEQVDPVTLEVVRNALVAIVREMTDNLIRTAYSPIAAEIKDFSVGFARLRGQLHFPGAQRATAVRGRPRGNHKVEPESFRGGRL